jgi:hypothetical protein
MFQALFLLSFQEEVDKVVKEVEKEGKDAWTKNPVVFRRENQCLQKGRLITINQTWLRCPCVSQIPLASPPVDT